MFTMWINPIIFVISWVKYFVLSRKNVVHMSYVHCENNYLSYYNQSKAIIILATKSSKYMFWIQYVNTK